MKRFMHLVVAAVLLLIPTGMSVSAAPIGLPLGPGAVADPPLITAASWILYDDTFDIVLSEFNSTESRPMASTTKIMTGILALENGDLGDLVQVSETAAGVGEAEINLEAGEWLTLRQLTAALMVRSANDAAIAVAEHIGGSVTGFVSLMNARAAELGLTSTHFANPHGLDAPGHYTSARDLLTMALHGMDIPQFAEFASTTSVTIPDASDGAPRVATATNRLLGSYEGALGVKTGYTDDAKLVLVSAAERDGRRIYAVVMGSDQHFDDARALLDYGFDNFLTLTSITVGAAHPAIRTPVVEPPPETAPETTVPEPVVSSSALVSNGKAYLVVKSDGEVISKTPVGQPRAKELPGLVDAFDWLTGLLR